MARRDVSSPEPVQVTRQILVSAATVLFCVLALLVLLVVTLIALGLMGPIAGLLCILAFIFIIWLGLWSLEHFLYRSGPFSESSDLESNQASGLHVEDVTVDLAEGL